MKKPFKALVFGLAALGALVADNSPQSTFLPGFVPEAAAAIGRPWTPVSYAGVARRTTRRAVAATSAAAAPPPATHTTVVVTTPPPAVPSVPIGTVLTALPAGCTVSVIGGVEYHQCAGVYYRAAFQGNNLVYVATQP